MTLSQLCCYQYCMIIKSAMLLPIFLKCQGTKLWNIGDILCLKYILPILIHIRI